MLGDDVRALFNHDPNQVLGRTSARTLDVGVDATGLWFKIQPGTTQLHRDVAQLIDRGDITGSSFGFRVSQEDWQNEGKRSIRTIEEVGQLFDVGPVTFPAYEATNVEASGLGFRSAEDLEELRQKAVDAQLRAAILAFRV